METNENLDEYGRYLLSSNDAVELMLHGKDVSGCFFLDEQDVLMYNTNCSQVLGETGLNIYEKNETSFEDFHAEQVNKWNIPWEYQILDIKHHIMNLCDGQEEIDRVTHEMELFEKFNLLNMLRFMKYFVDTMRKERTVWGVGRGSSVSVYTLYLMGVHRVDSIKYNLDCKEFFKE